MNYGSKGSLSWIYEVDWKSLYKEWGTPLYVYNERYIIDRLGILKDIFKDMNLDIYYAVKANANPTILNLLRDGGVGFEAASIYEAMLVLNTVTRQADRVMINSCCLDYRQMEDVARLGIKVNADTLNQLRFFIERGYHDLGARVDPGIGAGHHHYTVTGGALSKFGIPIDDLRAKIRSEELSSLRRVHFHLGSGISDPEIYARALEILWERLLSYHAFPEIDIGGGFSYPYRDGDRDFDFSSLRERLTAFLYRYEKSHGIIPKIIIEPGRWLIAGAGVLMAKVVDIKVKNEDTFVMIDTGIHHLLRPALYGAFHRVAFPSHPVESDAMSAYIAGNSCENSDIFPEKRIVPMGLRIGDIALILDVGAYGYVMSSNYNAYPKPRELLIDKNGKVVKTDSFDMFLNSSMQTQ